MWQHRQRLFGTVKRGSTLESRRAIDEERQTFSYPFVVLNYCNLNRHCSLGTILD
jgi:hypothetical protein